MSAFWNWLKSLFGGKAEAPKQVAAPGESQSVTPSDTVTSAPAPVVPAIGKPSDGSISNPSTPSSGLLKGGDFSHFDPETDWKAYAESHAFAAAKMNDGASGPDSKGASQRAGCQSVSLPYIGYHFFRFGVDPVAQAKAFYKAFGALQKGEAWAADYEWDNVSGIARYANGGQTDAAGNDQFMTFIEEMEQLFGMGAIIYTGKSFMPMKDERFSSRKLWVFDWHTTGKNTPTVHDRPILPPSWNTWDLWQYSDREQTSGAGRVDMNAFNGDAAALARLVKS